MVRLGEILIAAGIVAWPLMIFSVVAIALIGERIVFWTRILRRQDKTLRQVMELYREDPDLAIEKLKRSVDLPVARIFLEALSLEDAAPEEFCLAMEGAIQAEVPILKRFSNVFDTIISLSPLLGLLGTVLGLIQSFASLNLGDLSGNRTVGVTSGISEALTSTALGLVVALVTLFFANTFRGFYLRQLARIQEYAAAIELLYRRRYKQKEARRAPTPSA